MLFECISGWVNDEKFIDGTGKAKTLPMDGDECSFSALIKEFSGDITTKAMLDLLLAAGCITQDGSNVELIKHAYVPGKDSAEVIRILGTDTNELINTIDYNLTTDENHKRYQRKVSTAVLNKDAIEEFKNVSKKPFTKPCSKNSMHGYLKMKLIQMMKMHVTSVLASTITNKQVQGKENEHTD